MKPDWSFDPILPHMSEEIASRNWRDNCLLTLGWARCLRWSRATLIALVALSAVPAPAATPDWLRSAAQARLSKYPDDTKAVVLYSEQITTVTSDGARRSRFSGRRAGNSATWLFPSTRTRA